MKNLHHKFLTATIGLHLLLIALTVLFCSTFRWQFSLGIRDEATTVFVFLSLTVFISCYACAYFLKGCFLWWILTTIIGFGVFLVIFTHTFFHFGLLS